MALLRGGAGSPGTAHRRPSTGASEVSSRGLTPREGAAGDGDGGHEGGGASRRRGGGGHASSSLYQYQSAGVNLPKGEGKLYSRFYRDPPVMDVLGATVLFNVARSHLRNGTSDVVRVWCCGCSSGEEVYSVRFLWRELLEPHFSAHVGLQITGTDASEQQIATCMSATYSSAGMGTLPKGWKERCFVAAGKQDGDDLEYLVGSADSSAVGDEAMRDAGLKLVEPEVGMPVICSTRAPDKMQAAFKQHSADGSGTICEIKDGQCKVAFVESGQFMWCSTGKRGLHLAPSFFAVCPDLREGISFRLQDVRDGVPSSTREGSAQEGGGQFDVVLCRYSAFLYLSTEEAQTALKAIVDVLAPGGYLIIGQREMLPVAKNLSVGLNQIAECACIYQKDPDAAPALPELRQRAPLQVHRRGQGLPPIAHYETLDAFYVEALHQKGVQSMLGREPWRSLHRSHFSESSAKILEASDRPKGPVLHRIECAEGERVDSAKKLCEQGGIHASVKKAVYKRALIDNLVRKNEEERSVLAAANKVVPARQLQQFVDRMASDMARRQDKFKDLHRESQPDAISGGAKSKRLKVSKAALPRVALLASRPAPRPLVSPVLRPTTSPARSPALFPRSRPRNSPARRQAAASWLTSQDL